ncbi:hypothetical protein B598_0681 [Chlamydia psittaci GR9]|uniref:DUF1389 domain-containing protein n=1 Tax=Chlamydia psittaci TaxID=83554 RepID=UPI00027E189D|nr:DUF1389 domain-containing protein [Chlamydia psittaci]AFS20760.1 hypothetical protein B598_0681 [Chlamydia psittaci GR9]
MSGDSISLDGRLRSAWISLSLRSKEHCPLDKLSHHAAAITSIVYSVFSGVFVFLLAYGFSHPLIIFGLVLSLCIVGITSVLALRRFLHELHHPLPSGFRRVLEKNYPRVICDLVFDHALNLKELRALLLCMSSGNFDLLPEECKGRVTAGDFERLHIACHGVQIPDLETLLLRNCPLYFINKFIQLGPRELPEAEHMEPEIYWVNRVGLSDVNLTAFHPCVWLLAHIVSQEEYITLLEHARHSTWNSIQDLVNAIRLRMNHSLEGMTEDENFTSLLACLNQAPAAWLLAFCKHGVSWEQLQLFKDVDCDLSLFLHTFDKSRVSGVLMELMLVVCRYIDEENIENFDPKIALLTLTEWMNYYYRDDQRMYGLHKGALQFFNKRSRHMLQQRNLSREHLNYYMLNKDTGDRFLKWIYSE